MKPAVLYVDASKVEARAAASQRQVESEARLDAETEAEEDAHIGSKQAPILQAPTIGPKAAAGRNTSARETWHGRQSRHHVRERERWRRAPM